MSDPAQTQTVIQQDIDTLLKQLKDLREQITRVRAEIAPLEANLKQSYDDFQVVVGAVRRQSMRLQSEIANLRARINSLRDDTDDEIELESRNEDIADRNSTVQAEKDPEAVEKDMLFEHLLRILDPMDDADLFANLQTLCQDPTVSLAEVLEQSPWALVWQVRAIQETLVDQYHRLHGWETSLTRQLETLNRVEDRLRKDPRYGLWQQQQKGTEVWQQFLQQAVEQQEDQNHELQNELETLRQEWEQLRGALI
jgi:predicted  nucleic acid-binding Zn-ribbon protein